MVSNIKVDYDKGLGAGPVELTNHLFNLDLNLGKHSSFRLLDLVYSDEKKLYDAVYAARTSTYCVVETQHNGRTIFDTNAKFLV